MQLIHYPDLKFLSMHDPEKGQNFTGILAQLLHNYQDFEDLHSI
jgi:hypothetical protein